MTLPFGLAYRQGGLFYEVCPINKILYHLIKKLYEHLPRFLNSLPIKS